MLMIEALRKVIKRMHYPLEVMLTCVRWYAAYPLSLRHIEEMMAERGVVVDHATVHRWAIKILPVLAAVFRRRLRGGDERAAATGQARCQRLQDRHALHRHRVFAYVQAQAFALQPIAARHDQGRWDNSSVPVMSSSTLNGIEPFCRNKGVKLSKTAESATAQKARE